MIKETLILKIKYFLLSMLSEHAYVVHWRIDINVGICNRCVSRACEGCIVLKNSLKVEIIVHMITDELC